MLDCKRSRERTQWQGFNKTIVFLVAVLVIIIASSELAAQEEAKKKETGEDKAEQAPLPKGNFAALISMLTTQALFAMGVLKVEGQEKEPDLEMAKYNIDMLETLEEKTKGNLTEEEKKVLENTLSQVRMTYVKVAG